MIEITNSFSCDLGIDLFTIKKEIHIHSPIGSEYCEMCNFWTVNPIYVEIIRKLKEAKILSKDYPLMCCTCYSLMNRKEII